jgi:serine/threonine protein phosphatase 1
MTGRLLAIGDIHGCNRELKQLLARIKVDPNADTLVFIGDYIDRGPDVRGVIDTMIDLKKACRNVICLKGNHEAMFLDFYLEGRGEELFLSNGGWNTLSSYGLTLADTRKGTGLPEGHLGFLTSLALCHETRDYLFVHAGLRPGLPLAEQSPDDLLWIRHEFIDSNFDFGKTVVFGHTPLYAPLLEENKIGIDTGAVYGGKLTCIELPSRRIYQA